MTRPGESEQPLPEKSFLFSPKPKYHHVDIIARIHALAMELKFLRRRGYRRTAYARDLGFHFGGNFLAEAGVWESSAFEKTVAAQMMRSPPLMVPLDPPRYRIIRRIAQGARLAAS